jgi:hypothetical protein
MSARSPSATRWLGTSVPTTSPTAMMSAVVSTMTTMKTMSMETIAPISKIGAPKWNGVGNASGELLDRSRVLIVPLGNVMNVLST